MFAKKKGKKLLPVIAVILVAALGVGIWLGTRGGGEPVNVYPFMYIGMTEFWGDNQESYGPVTTDKIQTEFLSDTQTVTEVKVKDGDMVKKGDVLFTFDTTLDALTLERKRLEVEKVQVQIKAAEERLQETREMVPYVPAGETPPGETEPDVELKDRYSISKELGEDGKTYDGKTQETALICWLKDGVPVTDDILNALLEKVNDYQANGSQDTEANAVQGESSASGEPEENEKQERNESEAQEGIVTIKYSVTGKTKDSWEETVNVMEKPYDINDAISYPNQAGETYWLVSAIRLVDGTVLQADELEIPAYPKENVDEQENWESKWSKGMKLVYTRDVSFEGSVVKEDRVIPIEPEKPVQLQAGQEAFLVITSEIHNLGKEANLKYSITPQNGIFKTSTDGKRFYLTGVPKSVTTEPEEYQPEEYQIEAYYTFDSKKENRAVKETFTFSVSVLPYAQENEFYVVFKTTDKNYLKGNRLVWHGAKVTAYEDGSFDVAPYDASGFGDHTLPLPEDADIDLPEIDPNAIYTAEEILEMQKQCYATIKEQNEKLKMVETEYNIMQRELGDGNIYAEIDGKVVSLLTEEEARAQEEPLVKVSGGGGFYISGSVSGREKEKLKIGQEVTINDWNSGGIYTGEVVSVGDFPSDSDNWNGMGNPTASYYPFKAFVGEEADLRAGSYVSMSYSTSAGEQGIYLEKAFVRTEKGNSYIYVRGADGKLEKRNVKLGKLLWGSYYEILSPLSEADYLAFPYGKHVKPGATTVESDLSALYTY